MRQVKGFVGKGLRHPFATLRFGHAAFCDRSPCRIKACEQIATLMTPEKAAILTVEKIPVCRQPDPPEPFRFGGEVQRSHRTSKRASRRSRRSGMTSR